LKRLLFLFLALSLARAGPQTSGARQSGPSENLPAIEKTYDEQLKLRPDAETWQRLGLVRHLQNKFEPAIPAFRQAIRLNPSLWTAHLFLGMCLYRTNRFAEAAAALERAARLAPAAERGRDDVDYWLGATRIATGKTLAGLQALENLLARNPKHMDALELSTRAYAEFGTALWNDVAERSFETAAGYEIHGNALESEGNREGALQAYRESQALDPKRAGPGFAIGRLLLRDGKAEDAFQVLSREALLPGAAPETLFYAGLAAIQLNRFAEAAPLLYAALPWDARQAAIPLALAQGNLGLQDRGKAAEAARRALSLQPDSAAARELLAAAER
jgi:tetratricopeptide (TPR) repeat protein